MRTWTDEQSKAIETSGKVLVSASAGSGKTAVMVERVARAIIGGADVERILVMTFTNAAAREMRERIEDALYEAVCSGKSELKEQLDKLPLAQIGTIDAFCGRVAKRYFEQAGVDPSFEIIGADDRAALIKDSLDELLNESAESGDKNYFTLLDHLSQRRKTDLLQKLILRLYDFLCVLPDRNAWLKDKAKYIYEHAEELRTEIFSKLISRAAKLAALGEELNIGRGVELISILEESVRGCAAADGFRELTKRAVRPELPNLNTKAYKLLKQDELLFYNEMVAYRGNCHTFLDECAKWGELCSDAGLQSTKSGERDIDALVALTLRFAEIFEGKKLKNNTLDFADVTAAAYRALKDDAVREELSGEFDGICVDEYQDVNRLQEEIFKLIDSKGKVFMVGDPKQSIYGFRHTEPEIFIEKAHAEPDVESLSMKGNFRTDKRILHFINSIFSDVMTEETGGIDYISDSVMTAMQEFETVNDVPPVTVADYQKDNSKNNELRKGVYSVKADEQYESFDEQLEAEYIAPKISELVGQKLFVKRVDDKPVTRELTYSDIAVLARTKESVEKIYARLSEYGIPAYAEYELTDTDAEAQLNTVLRLVDNSLQDIPLIAVMKAFFDFTEDELYALRSADDKPNFYETVFRSGADESEKLKNFKRVLEDYKARAAYMTVYELARHIVTDRDFGLRLRARKKDEADRLEAYIDSLYGLKCAQSLPQFIRFLNSSADKGKNVEYGNRAQGVSVLTIHKSKGLEFSVVFVAGCGKEFNHREESDDLLLNKDYGIALRSYDEDRRVKSGNFATNVMKDKLREKSIREEMRLLYVALTRAKSHLFICGAKPSEKEGKKTLCYMDWINSPNRDENVRYEKIISREMSNAEILTEGRALPIGANKDDVETVRNYFNRSYPYIESTKTGLKYTVSELNSDSEEQNGIKLYYANEGESRESGILYHKVLQHIDFGASCSDKVENELDALVEQGILSDDERRAVSVQKIVNCLDTDVMRYASENKCVREQSFMLLLPAADIGVSGATDDVLVQGVIDLWVRGERNIIVDYKLSGASAETLIAKYSAQLKLYRTAVERITGQRVDGLYILSINSGKVVEIA